MGNLISIKQELLAQKQNSVPVPIVGNLHPPIALRTNDMFTSVERIKNIFIKLMLCLDAGDVIALYMYIVC